MEPSSSNDSSRVLLTNRIIWFAMMMGQFGFLAVLILVILPGKQSAPQPLLLAVGVIMLATIIPVAFFIRRFILRRGAVDGGVRADAFASANLIFWAGCEAMSFFGLVVVMLTATLWPAVVISAIAMGCQALAFPVGGTPIVPVDASANV